MPFLHNLNNRNHKKPIIFFVVISLFTLNSFCQDSYVKKRWNIKACYSALKNETYIAFPDIKSVKNYKFEVNYGLFKNLEVGAYFGYSMFEVKYVQSNSSISFRNANTPFYGLNTNFHILPFFIKKDDFRFDLYVSGKLGGYYVFSSENYSPNGNYFDYGIYAGGSFYLFKHMGAFAEIGYGKKINLLYGLTFKF